MVHCTFQGSQSSSTKEGGPEEGKRRAGHGDGLAGEEESLAEGGAGQAQQADGEARVQQAEEGGPGESGGSLLQEVGPSRAAHRRPGRREGQVRTKHISNSGPLQNKIMDHSKTAFWTTPSFEFWDFFNNFSCCEIQKIF